MAFGQGPRVGNQGKRASPSKESVSAILKLSLQGIDVSFS